MCGRWVGVDFLSSSAVRFRLIVIKIIVLFFLMAVARVRRMHSQHHCEHPYATATFTLLSVACRYIPQAQLACVSADVPSSGMAPVT